MRTIRDIKIFSNIPIIVRAALNVPIENGKVVNNYRLRKALPTIQFLAERGAKVVIVSHMGNKGTETLEPVAKELGELISGVSFFGESVGERARKAVRAIAPGKILVMENLRRHKGEKLNDPTFARELASLGDAFVQDSFDTCHRKHSSIVGVPSLLPSYAGLLVEEEVLELSKARSPKRPSLAVIGGAKFESKEAVLNTLLEIYDHVFVGGALASDFLKARGFAVGKSLVSEANVEGIIKIANNPKLLLPRDLVVLPFAGEGAPDTHSKARVALVGQIHQDEISLDHGPETSKMLAGLAASAETILWGGPLGNYENGFVAGTNDFAHSVAGSKAQSYVGGGDTVAAIEGLGLMSQFSFVSTGGGAMLDYLAHGTLPGIEALSVK